MKKYFFTFGQKHTHRHGDVTLDCDSVVLIRANSYSDARLKMVETFGCKWAFQYSEDEFKPEYFPRGVVLELESL